MAVPRQTGRAAAPAAGRAISALQTEYSLWTRDVEQDGVDLVAQRRVLPVEHANVMADGLHARLGDEAALPAHRLLREHVIEQHRVDFAVECLAFCFGIFCILYFYFTIWEFPNTN